MYVLCMYVCMYVCVCMYVYMYVSMYVCMYDILHTRDQGGAAILLLLDCSAAFDTIDLSILLSSMESVLGVKVSVLQWFISYLLGRKQSAPELWNALP